uniref:Uncharacterized protein n=1 Tax=Arundo donax TaxID=35708 RepID=A0A0A9FAP9_ARUDO
MLSCCLASRN